MIKGFCFSYECISLKVNLEVHQYRSWLIAPLDEFATDYIVLVQNRFRYLIEHFKSWFI